MNAFKVHVILCESMSLVWMGEAFMNVWNVLLLNQLSVRPVDQTEMIDELPEANPAMKRKNRNSYLTGRKRLSAGLFKSNEPHTH